MNVLLIATTTGYQIRSFGDAAAELGIRLVLIARWDSLIDTVAIGPGFDLALLVGDGRIATGEISSVPVG